MHQLRRLALPIVHASNVSVESLCVKAAVQANNSKLTVDFPSQYVNLTRSLDKVGMSSMDFNQTERKMKEIKVYMAAQKQRSL